MVREAVTGGPPAGAGRCPHPSKATLPTSGRLMESAHIGIATFKTRWSILRASTYHNQHS
jgi:hypothetical protein